MIRRKSHSEIETLRQGGKRLASILGELQTRVAPGVTSEEINDIAFELFKKSGGKPAFYRYAPPGNKKAFPACVCVSVNEVIVHGIPNRNPHTFENGDVVTLDGGMLYEGLITDSAVTFVVGEATPEQHSLLAATQEALYAGIKAARPGGHIGDIGAAIENVAKRTGYSITEHLAGHGVGYAVHEDPYVPNEGVVGSGELIEPGLVIAIEPMFTLGGGAVEFHEDEFTVTTKDGSLSAHFEHTVAITENGPEIVTKQ